MFKVIYQESIITPFSDPMSAVKFGFNHRIDMVFTEIPMKGIDGFTLARLIGKHNEQMEVCFTTETMDYVDEAIGIQTCGYLQKPITVEKLKSQIYTVANGDEGGGHL